MLHIVTLTSSWHHVISLILHVWYIYLHLGGFWMFLGQMLVNIPHMEHMGINIM